MMGWFQNPAQVIIASVASLSSSNDHSVLIQIESEAMDNTKAIHTFQLSRRQTAKLVEQLNNTMDRLPQ